jgi:predicted transport protein
LRRAFADLRELKVDVAYPFLLELYADYKAGLLSQEDFLRAVRLVEAYVFRRAVCSVPTNSMNKTFATFIKAVRKDRYLESIEAQFMLLPSYRRFPADEEFHRELQQRDLYNFRSRSYWLRKFENYGRKEFVPVEEYTIEHILPQNENLCREWKADLGEEWERIQQTWLHTLGNLTLTAYNAEYSDRPFAEKRDRPGGFKESPLRLNKGLGDTQRWDEVAIKERASRLATQAIDVWPAPQVSPEALSSYREKRSSSTAYTREDHPHLQSPVTGQIFDAFRKAVLALDPCVTEEFLKLYVAYKAETNFVDVVPQAKGLRLSINMMFSDIIDSRGLCKDIANLGRWGNGDVEIKLTNLDDLPYVVGLVRQSLDQQLGVTADA